MRKVAIALLTTTLITGGAAAANNNQQQSPGAQPQQRNTQQQNQDRTQQGAQQQAKPPSNQQAAQDNKNQQASQDNKIVSPQDLSRGKIRKLQQALDRDGFNPGPTDGHWGPRTEDAIKQFQQSKQIQSNGQLDRQTVADLGLDASTFSHSQGGQR
jgi:hypothetical protein